MKFLSLILGLLITAVPASPAFATGYPDRPIKLVVPGAAGTSLDSYCRWVATPLATVLGQPIVIENRPGAGGTIGTDAVAKSKPDGYTLLAAPIAAMTILPVISKDVQYKLRDLQPVIMLQVNPFLVVVPTGLPVTDLKSLVAYAKANPGKLNYGSPGLGSLGHLATELFNSTMGIKMVHIPFRGGQQVELVSNRIQVLFSNAGDALPHVRSGRLRVLAVTGKERMKDLPDVPTVAESGFPGYEALAWNGIAVAAGTPKEIVMRLHDEIEKILRTPEMAAQMATMGSTPAPAMSPEQFGAFMATESNKWGALALQLNLKLE